MAAGAHHQLCAAGWGGSNNHNGDGIPASSTSAQPLTGPRATKAGHCAASPSGWLRTAALSSSSAYVTRNSKLAHQLMQSTRRSSADRLIWRSRERTCFMRPSCPAGASRRAASFCATLTCDVLLSISRCFNRTGEMLLRRSIAPPTARGRRERMREEKEEWREMREER